MVGTQLGWDGWRWTDDAETHTHRQAGRQADRQTSNCGTRCRMMMHLEGRREMETERWFWIWYIPNMP